MPRLSLAKLERHLYSAADRLRQEGLDAAIYKDYIFGMLFLKRCSDVFDAEREKIIGRKVEEGMVKDEAETEYGENADYYDGFFVPERSRWRYLQSRLSDASNSHSHSSIVPLERVRRIIGRAFSFYSAFFLLNRKLASALRNSRVRLPPVTPTTRDSSNI